MMSLLFRKKIHLLFTHYFKKYHLRFYRIVDEMIEKDWLPS